MKQLKAIKDKIEQLGGVDFLDRKKSQKVRDKVLEKENLEELITAFIDDYGFAMFNNTIGYKTIEKVPVAGNGLCEVAVIFGWSNDVHGVKWSLEQLKDEVEGYFPFAEGFPGDYVCVCTKKNTDKGKIYYWAHEEGELYLIANSFEEFVMSWELNQEDNSDDDNLLDGLIDFSFADDF
ncbi:MAG: SMI1/KNR4 family protein [Bacteroidetes bacterium]|nr:SMI1/KNR4 family protein [Bacteroidota bacterium]